MSNQLKTVLFLGALTAILIWFGNVIGGTEGMMVALAMVAIMNFVVTGFRINRAADVWRPGSDPPAGPGTQRHGGGLGPGRFMIKVFLTLG